MSKSYKKKVVKEEVVDEIDNETELTKKELYDLNKKQKDEEKLKASSKKEKKKKKKKNAPRTSLIGRIFAILMLILMVGSVVATIASHMS